MTDERPQHLNLHRSHSGMYGGTPGVAGRQIACGCYSERRFWLYPMDGGQPRALSGIEPGDAIRWSADRATFRTKKQRFAPY